MKNLCVGLGIICYTLQAEDLYVRPNGGTYGTENGSSWSNAFDGFSDISWGSGAGSLGAGDTLWIAGGTYTDQLVIGASGTVGSSIVLKRVRSTDSVPVAAAGWNSSFDSQVVLGGNQTTFSDSKGNWTLDGQIPDGMLSAQGTDGFALLKQGPGDNVRIQYITMTGPGFGAFCGYGINFITGTNQYVGHCKFDGIIQQLSWSVSSGTVEYCTFLNAGPGTPECHSDMIYCGGGSSSTFRYNYFYNSYSQAFFWDGGGNAADDTYIYGNIAVQGPGGTGTWFQTKQGFTWGKFHIYNNVMVSWSTAGVQFRGTSTGPNELKNNIFWQTDWTRETTAVTGIDSDYNRYSGTKNALDSTHSFGSLSNPFVSTTLPGDWHIVAASTPVNNGVSLGSPYNTDIDGNTRGADGTWDVGAYEYTAGGGSGLTYSFSSIGTWNISGTLKIQ